MQLRQAEVGQLRVAAPRDQDVLGLDVAMQDAGLVRRGQTIGDADQQLDDLAPAALAPAIQSLSVPPSTNSVTRYCRPSNSPASCTVRMCGWLSDEAVCASRWKRRRAVGSASRPEET